MSLQPNDVIRVSLTAQEWQSVLLQLAGRPYRGVAPLIASIQSQCVARAPEPAASNVIPLNPNTEDAGNG